MTDPIFYNDLKLSLQQVFELWQSGIIERKSPLHAPTVASVEKIEGGFAPTQRVMVLRAFDWASRTMRFHTDRRSTKCSAITGHDAMSVLGYHAPEKVQLRMTGRGEVLTHGPVFDAAWEASTLFARRCYLTQGAPGASSEHATSGLPKEMEGVQPTEAQIGPGRENFAVLLFTFDAIDWLYLANSGHRRAQFHWDLTKNNWVGTWVLP